MSTKKHILEMLESSRGQSISGEHIADCLGVTRNTVWKVMKDLKKDGYRIKAVTNKGYCLCEDNDILSVQGMLPYLSEKEMSDRIYMYDSLESTNKTAKEMAISGAEHGTAVIADCQTDGKGRFDREFFSPPGHGIYMSLILRPTRSWLDTPTVVTALAAVSVCEAIEDVTGKSPQIKWVNDIYLAGKKICGILSEAVTDFESGNIQWVVVGIGVNFSTPPAAFPEDLRQEAGSVFESEKPSATRNHLAARIMNIIAAPGHEHDKKEILGKYRKRLMLLGDEVLVAGQGESYKAVAIDIDDTGRLIVRKDTGETLLLSAGEVKLPAPRGGA